MTAEGSNPAQTPLKKGEKRLRYSGNTAKLMAVADGYVMARCPHAIPFIMSEKEWRTLEKAP